MAKRKRGEPEPTLAEQIERQEQAALFRSAQAKGLKGLTGSEKAAVARHEEGTFLRMLGSCRKTLAAEAIGASSKVIIDNADRRGFPWPRGKRDRVNIEKVLRWLWRYFLDHPLPDGGAGGKLSEEDVLLVGASQDLKDEFLRERILERRLVRRQKEMEITLLEESHVPTEKVEACFMAMAELTRRTSSSAQRSFAEKFGDEAGAAVHELVVDLADAWERRALNEFGDGSAVEE